LSPSDFLTTPISPPSGPAPRLLQGPPSKSKFLAAAAIASVALLCVFDSRSYSHRLTVCAPTLNSLEVKATRCKGRGETNNVPTKFLTYGQSLKGLGMKAKVKCPQCKAKVVVQYQGDLLSQDVICASCGERFLPKFSWPRTLIWSAILAVILVGDAHENMAFVLGVAMVQWAVTSPIAAISHHVFRSPNAAVDAWAYALLAVFVFKVAF